MNEQLLIKINNSYLENLLKRIEVINNPKLNCNKLSWSNREIDALLGNNVKVYEKIGQK